MGKTATLPEKSEGRITSCLNLLMGLDQQSLDVAVLLSKFDIAFMVSDAARPPLFWSGHYKMKAPALFEMTSYPERWIYEHRYRGREEIQNFIREYVLRAEDATDFPRPRSDYDRPRIDFFNTPWPGWTMNDRYVRVWFFDEQGGTLFKGDVYESPIPLFPTFSKSQTKIEDQGDLAAWRICPIRTLEERRGLLPLVSKNPPAVLMPHEVEQLSKDGEVIVVTDSSGFNGVAWSNFDAYFTSSGWLYRVWSHFQD